MEESESFTSMVNYGKIVDQLRHLGFQDVPSLETILNIVQGMEDVRLVEWTIAKSQNDDDLFMKILAFHFGAE